jgi:hypothetical protein
MTNDTRHALNTLTEVMASLNAIGGTWTLAGDTQRNAAENDNIVEHWVSMVNPAHPGAVVNFSRANEPNRWSVSANYLEHYEPYIYARGGRVYRESITVSITKTPAQIARDIERRLFAATNYLDTVAASWAKKTESDNQLLAGARTADALASILGTHTEYEKYRERPGLSHLTTDENRLKFNYFRHDFSGRVEGRVDYGGKKVALTLTDIDAGLAERILRMWKDSSQ